MAKIKVRSYVLQNNKNEIKLILVIFTVNVLFILANRKKTTKMQFKINYRYTT